MMQQGRKLTTPPARYHLILIVATAILLILFRDGLPFALFHTELLARFPGIEWLLIAAGGGAILLAMNRNQKHLLWISRSLSFVLLIGIALNQFLPFPFWRYEPLPSNSYTDLALYGMPDRAFALAFAPYVNICERYGSRAYIFHRSPEGDTLVNRDAIADYGCPQTIVTRRYPPILTADDIARLEAAHDVFDMLDGVFRVVHADIPDEDAIRLFRRGGTYWLVPQSLLPDPVTVFRSEVMQVFEQPDGILTIYRVENGAGVFVTSIDPHLLGDAEYTFEADDGWRFALERDNGDPYYDTDLIAPDGQNAEHEFDLYLPASLDEEIEP